MVTLNLFSEHIFLIGIVILIFFVNLSCIIYLVAKERKKDKEEIDDILVSLSNAKPRLVEENLTDEKAQIEEVEEVNKPKLEIEKVLEKMQKDLEATPEDAVATFEKDQEEKSIISYQELVNSLKKTEPVVDEMKKILASDFDEKLKEEDFTKEVGIDESADVEVIDILEDTVRIPNISQEEISKSAKEEKIDSTMPKKKFQNTDFISPIYGKLETKEMDYPTVPQFSRKDKIEELLDEPFSKVEDVIKRRNVETLDVESLHHEIEKNDEFLRALKNFRGNL